MGELFVPGQIVAETYRVRGLLGEGAMGAVYEADDLVLLRRVALKVVRSGIDPASLRHEAQVLAALRHPSMVTVFSMGRHANIDFIVLERIYGVSLEVHIARRNEARKPFEIDEIVRVLLGIVEGVFVLHRAAITHRDVKPSNIMIAPEGRVVLMDLGLAVPWSDRVSRDMISGTPAYMAPETIAAEVKLGQEHLVDLYAVGVIAFQLLTGAVPFLGSVNDVLLSQVIDNPPDLASLRSDAPAPLRTLVSRLLSKSPEERPHSAEAVVVPARPARPALFTSTSSCSPRSRNDSAARRTSARLARSSAMNSACPPAALISSTTGRVFSSDRHASQTFPPRLASSIAVARPMPVFAPVTTKVFRCSLVSPCMRAFRARIPLEVKRATREVLCGATHCFVFTITAAALAMLSLATCQARLSPVAVCSSRWLVWSLSRSDVIAPNDRSRPGRKRRLSLKRG